MNESEQIELAKAYVALSNAHKLEFVLPMFADKAVYHSSHVGEFKGREALPEVSMNGASRWPIDLDASWPSFCMPTLSAPPRSSVATKLWPTRSSFRRSATFSRTSGAYDRALAYSLVPGRPSVSSPAWRSDSTPRRPTTGRMVFSTRDGSILFASS